MESISGFLLMMVSVLLFFYFIFLFWFGKKGAKHSQSMLGFATARGKVNPWIVGMSFATTYASANLFIGVPGLAYQYGTSALWYTLGCFGASWIGLLLFAKKFWRFGHKSGGISTLPEWLGRRYNSKLLRILVSLLILFNIYYIVGQNVGLATIFETVIGISYFWGVIIAVSITIIYIGLGGAYAQMITDGIQGLIMAITSILVFVSLFWTIGGGWHVFGELSNRLAAIDPHLIAPLSNGGPYNSMLAIMAIQFMLFSFILMPHLLTKVLSIDKEEDLKPFTISAGITLFFISTLMVLGGLAARVLTPNLAQGDQAIPVYILEAFPPVITGFIIIGIITAVLSTTDGLYLGVTSSIGNDLYKPLASYIHRGKQLTEEAIDRRAVAVSKFALIIIGLISLYLSLERPDSLAMLIQFSFSAIISGVIAPLLLGYFWEKSNAPGAIAATLTGTILYVIFMQYEIIENMFIAMFISSVGSFVVMAIICQLTDKQMAPKMKQISTKA